MGKTGATFWLLALITNMILLIKQLLDNVEKVKKTKKYGSMSESEMKDRRKELSSLFTKRQTILLGIIKVAGDIIPAGQGS